MPVRARSGTYHTSSGGSSRPTREGPGGQLWPTRPGRGPPGPRTPPPASVRTCSPGSRWPAAPGPAPARRSRQHPGGRRHDPEPAAGADTPPGARRRWPRVLMAVLSVLVLVVSAAGAAGALVYNHLGSNITALDITDQVGTDRPIRPVVDEGGNYSASNILLMGSDTRQGEDNRGYGNASIITGQRSDTAILLHLSADRSRALAVSIPRDTWVMLPECKNRETGEVVGGYETKFNVAFEIGGPGCTVKLVEQLTGVAVDHFLVIDFGGLQAGHRRDGRRRGVPDEGGRRRQERPGPARRDQRRQGRAGACLRPHPQDPRGRVGPVPDPASAAVPVLADPQGVLQRAAAQPGVAVPGPRRGDQVLDR